MSHQETTLKNETAKTAVKTLNQMNNYIGAIIILTGTLSAITVALTNPVTLTKDQPVLVVAINGTGAICLGAFLAALISGTFIYFFAAVNSATRKAKQDIEVLVEQGVIKIKTSNKNNTIIWEAVDSDAANSDVGVEIQRTGSVGGFFPRQILERMSQAIPNN